MEATTGSTISNSQTTSNPPLKRLQFDRRYGWVYDEWKDPSEEALAGGRGMHAQISVITLLGYRSSSLPQMNIAASCAIEALEKHGQLSPPQLLDSFNDQLQTLIATVKKPGISIMGSGGNLLRLPATRSSVNSGVDTGKKLEEI